MSTPLTDGINALTQYANETTGKQDATLSDAVGSLVEGYGGGSVDVPIEEITIKTSTSGNARTALTAFQSDFPQWDGTKKALILIGGSYQAYKCLFLKGDVTLENAQSLGNIFVRYDSTDNGKISVGSISSSLNFTAGDKYLIVG